MSAPKPFLRSTFIERVVMMVVLMIVFDLSIVLVGMILGALGAIWLGKK